MSFSEWSYKECKFTVPLTTRAIGLSKHLTHSKLPEDSGYSCNFLLQAYNHKALKGNVSSCYLFIQQGLLEEI